MSQVRCRVLSRSIAVKVAWNAVCCVVGAGILVGTTVQPVLAKTDVRGETDAVQVQVDNASIRDVFDALAARFKLTYKLPPDIAVTVAGTYAGPLDQVLARLLRGQSYLLKTSEGRFEVIVLGPSGVARPALVKTGGGAPPALSANAPPAPSVAPLHAGLPPTKPVPPLSSYLTANGSGAGDAVVGSAP